MEIFMNESKAKKYRFLIAGTAIVLFLILVYLLGRPMINFVSEPEKFQIWVADKGILAILAFMGMNALQVMLAIIPGGPFEIVAGYAFGVVKGTIYCDLAMTAGSIITFLIARKFGMKFVQLFFSKEKIDSVKFLKASKKREALVFLFFLLPGTPKDLLSYLVGLTDMKLSTWILINLVGRAPAILLSALSGSSLGDARYEIFAITIAVILVLYIVGSLIYRHKNKASN